jgi:putative ABC transport system ATP-binding protein
MILADEPTAELDSAMAARVAGLFAEMSKKEGISILMTTHDVGLMGAADYLIELANGERVSEGE